MLGGSEKKGLKGLSEIKERKKNGGGKGKEKKRKRRKGKEKKNGNKEVCGRKEEVERPSLTKRSSSEKRRD